MRIYLKSTRHLFFKEIFHLKTGPLCFGKHGFDGIGILCVRRRKFRWQKTNWTEEGRKGAGAANAKHAFNEFCDEKQLGMGGSCEASGIN